MQPQNLAKFKADLNRLTETLRLKAGERYNEWDKFVGGAAGLIREHGPKTTLELMHPDAIRRGARLIHYWAPAWWHGVATDRMIVRHFLRWLARRLTPNHQAT